MTKQDPPPKSERLRMLEQALRQERRNSNSLEAEVARLQTDLDQERSKLSKVLTRRSVRLALKGADLGKPLVRFVRNLRDPRPVEQAKPTQQEVAAELCRLRPEEWPESGPLVSAVVLNRDGADHLERLLPGLRKTVYKAFELIVVDNGSTDTSVELLRGDWGFPITIIENAHNASFSRGCNQGLDAAAGEYVLLLNNDVQPISDHWLGAMVDELEKNPKRGAAGALLIYPERPGYEPHDPNVGPDLTVQHRGISFRQRRNVDPSATVPWAYNVGVGDNPLDPELVATVEVPAVTAACMLIRTGLLRELEGLDEAFVYGMEDVDLSLRIRDAGYGLAMVGSAALFHHEFGTQSQIATARKRAYGLSNVQHFSEKWGPRLSRLLQLEALLPGQHDLGVTSSQVAITVTRNDPKAGWGDWYTAHELGDALEAVGYDVVYAERHQDGWYQLGERVSLVISLIDGFDVRRAPTDALTVAWIRNWTDRWIEQPWFSSYDVYVPSSQTSADLILDAGTPVTAVVPLATNDQHFYPRPPNAIYSNDFAVTANYWKAARPGIEEVIVRPQEKFGIFGRGWEQVPRLSRYVRGHLPYEELPDVYSSCKIVIDETATPTLPYGALNSRVFDATASGALVITNNKIGSDELFDGALPVYSDARHQRDLLTKYLADDELRQNTVDSLREVVLSRHTYAHRAHDIPDAARDAILRPRIAIKIGTPDEQAAQHWGDTHYAEALHRALLKHGANPAIHLLADWEQPASQCVDVAIHLRGLGTYVPKPAHKNILWIISHPGEVTTQECEGYDLVLVASSQYAASLQQKVKVPVEVMHQATDAVRFAPSFSAEHQTELLFVGNSRGHKRFAVDAALEIDAPLHVYGQGWEDALPPGVLVASHFPNENLGLLYSSAGVTLNDHWPDMAQQGFVSNRMFDVIAAGGLIFTDPVAGLDELFGDLIPVFDSPAALRELLDDWSNRPEPYVERMAEARSIVLRDHTFEARASRIMELVASLGWSPDVDLG